jgi:hypothetical protein
MKQENMSVDEFAELVQEMVAEGYPDVPENVIDTIATDTFLKGIENKRAALTAMGKDQTTLESSLQRVKAAINNQRLILGACKSEIRKVRFNDTHTATVTVTRKQSIVLTQSTPDLSGQTCRRC